MYYLRIPFVETYNDLGVSPQTVSLASAHPEMAIFRNLCTCPVECEAYSSKVRFGF